MVVDDYMVDKVLDKVNKTNGIEKFDDTKTLISANDKLSDGITLKSGSHVSENFCQIKIFPSLVRKNMIVCLFRV